MRSACYFLFVRSMRTGSRLLLAVLQPALARAASGDPATHADAVDLSTAAGAATLAVGHGLRLSMDAASLSAMPLNERTTVFTSLYWSRAYEERAQLRERFGVSWAYGVTLDQYAAGANTYAAHSPLGYAESLRWSAKPMAGLQFERQNLLFHGDRLSVRASSDMQALFREVGVFRSSEEVDALSLLGWRSHSSLTWQLGEPTHEIQWQFSARFDRRAYAQTNTANFSLLRRF
jgi:hypothetical protein